jgi:hypothetical protein
MLFRPLIFALLLLAPLSAQAATDPSEGLFGACRTTSRVERDPPLQGVYDKNRPPVAQEGCSTIAYPGKSSAPMVFPDTGEAVCINNSSVNSFFIPLKTRPEWESFKRNHPPMIEIVEACESGGQTVMLCGCPEDLPGYSCPGVTNFIRSHATGETENTMVVSYTCTVRDGWQLTHQAGKCPDKPECPAP